jgi:hypothetical protein
MKAFFAVALGLAISCCAYITCEAASVAELKAVVEGVYILDEWHNDGKIFRPPQVEARTVLMNGSIVYLSVNKMEDANQITSANFGVYTLQADSFGYRYDNRSVFTQTPNNITVTHAPAWEGMRNFSVTQEGDSVRFQSRSADQAEFLFMPGGLRYSEGGKVLRIYHRTKSE